MKPAVMIVGGGKTGSHLAALLGEAGHAIRVVEWRRDVLARLHKELPTEAIVEGDGTDAEVLRAADIQSFPIVAAMTGADEVNLAIAALARLEFRVPRVIARVNNPKNAWLFTPEMGVDVPLNQTKLLAQMIAETISFWDVMALLKAQKGGFSTVDLVLPAGSPAAGKTVATLELPAECVLVAVIRQNEMLVPRGHTELRAGDEVVAVVSLDQKDELVAALVGAAGQN